MRLNNVYEVEATQVSWDVIKDRRLSPTDLGVYVRFCYAAQLFRYPDLDLLVEEMKMPRLETEAALQRLMDFGYLEVKPSAGPHPQTKAGKENGTEW